MNVLFQTAFQYWEQLDHPTSLGLYLLARNKQWDEVLTHKVIPESFDDLNPSDFAKAIAAVSFLKKNPHVPGKGAASRKAAALDTWFDGERRCYETNDRLAAFEVHPLQTGVQAEFLRLVRKRIISWLGSGPSDDEIHRNARHGPGTTFSSSVAKPTAADKFSEIPTLTHDAVWFLASLVGTKWGASIASRYEPGRVDYLCYTRGNRFTTVPKDAVRDRSIGIEGSINVYFQLALGSAMRSRLRRNCGWDLDTAAQIHREMAKTASIDGTFATIDLSNASDTLSKSLVRILFSGTGWLHLMEDLRSKRTFVNGRWHLLEKFSSMGNGYTFELETVIFAALASVWLEQNGHLGLLGVDLFVFGDDIIVPTGVAESLIRVLAFAGFTANGNKTFFKGSFRESCGADFFRGHNVRGFYLKSDVKPDTEATFTVHNGAKRAFKNCGVNSPWFLEWVRYNLIHPKLQVGGPDRLGDSVLHGAKERVRWKRGIRWIKVVSWTRPIVIPWSHFSDDCRLTCTVAGYVAPRGLTQRGGRRRLKLEYVSDS